MVVFALHIREDPKVNGFMKKVNLKLNESNMLSRPFKGKCRRVGKELYVVSVTPLYPRFLFNVLCLLMLVSSILLKIAGFHTGSKIVFACVILAFFIINLFWMQDFYVLILRLQIRRLMGKAWPVQRGEALLLERLLNGKI